MILFFPFQLTMHAQRVSEMNSPNLYFPKALFPINLLTFFLPMDMQDVSEMHPVVNSVRGDNSVPVHTRRE